MYLIVYHVKHQHPTSATLFKIPDTQKLHPLAIVRSVTLSGLMKHFYSSAVQDTRFVLLLVNNYSATI